MQKYAQDTPSLGPASIRLKHLRQDDSQQLTEAGEVFNCPLGMFGTVTLNLRSGHNGIAQVPFASVARHRHK